MARKKKYDEESMVLGIRVPKSRYNELKAKLEAWLKKQLK